jgi:serine/threonine protein kinase
MAPEIYTSPHRHGTASEWFSVGVTFHEFLTGCRPFPVSRFQKSCAAGKTITPVDFSVLTQTDKISTEAKDFIEQLLDISPISRLGSSNGLHDFKRHSLLVNYDWASVLKGKSKAPIIPNEKSFIIDVGDLGTQREIRDLSKVVQISEDDHKKFALFRMRDTKPHYSVFMCGMVENKNTISLEVYILFTSTKIDRDFLLLTQYISYRHRTTLNILDLPLACSRLR